MGELIRLEYEIKIKGGKVIESSAEGGPLELVLGQRRLLPALERVIAGLAEGQEARGTLAAASAFGDEALLPVKDIARSEFPPGEAPVVGKEYQARAAGDGEPVRLRVVAVSDAAVTVRFLHPLGEADLEYWFKRLPPKRPGRPPPPPAHALGIDAAALNEDAEPN